MTFYHFHGKMIIMLSEISDTGIMVFEMDLKETRATLTCDDVALITGTLFLMGVNLLRISRL